MLLFCPCCSNVLTISRIRPGNIDAHLVGKNRFECRTCPYQFVLDKRYYERRSLKGKEVDDILGEGGSWGNCETTDVQCPNEKCDSTQAKFYQMQIRSADEPMTSFFKCIKCNKEWRE